MLFIGARPSLALSNPYRLVVDVSGGIVKAPKVVLPVVKKQVSKIPVLTKAPVKKRLTIVIDPGHGGRDPGAVGARGCY